MRSGRRRIGSGSSTEAELSYSRALVVADPGGDWIFVSGSTGVDYAAMILADGIEAQCGRALANIAAALAESGATFDDAVRVTYYVIDRSDFAVCAPQLRDAFAGAMPAATMLVVAGLLDPRMLIEIEVTARLLPRHPRAGGYLSSTNVGADGSPPARG